MLFTDGVLNSVEGAELSSFTGSEEGATGIGSASFPSGAGTFSDVVGVIAEAAGELGVAGWDGTVGTVGTVGAGGVFLGCKNLKRMRDSS